MAVSHRGYGTLTLYYSRYFLLILVVKLPGLAENTGKIELGAAPLVQHYSVFSAQPGLGYGTLIHCALCRGQCEV